MDRTFVLRMLALATAALVGCAGPRGPDGATGATGAQGATGDKGDPGTTGAKGDPGQPGTPGQPGVDGTVGCDGLAPGQTRGIVATLSLSAPAAGAFFAKGESIALTFSVKDRCGRTYKVADLGAANLYLSGPRDPLRTKTASKLLNCVVNRAAADRQHHFINLAAPSFADPAQHNLVANADGSLLFTTAKVTDEPAGTYTFGLSLKSKDEVDQVLAFAELQIGTATAETYQTGASDQSTCYACHRGTLSGKSYQAHIFPSAYSAFGSYALDQSPVASCQLCHNLDGYSANPTVRKVHAAHRGANQLAAGVAHPEYGLGADPTLAEFLDVGFPSMPDGEKDCAKCHVDDRFKTNPSRLACGTCHENVFFDTGTLTPPRVFGRPAAGPCSVTADCAADFGSSASCDTASGDCQLAAHPIQADDSHCALCHPADLPGLAPISASHEILSRTRVRNLMVIDVSVVGASGANGTFLVGDTPTLKFKLTDKAGAFVDDLATNANLAGTVVVAGPNGDDPQRLFSQQLKGATLAHDAATHEYSYTFPSPIPANALAPVNTTAPYSRPNPPGSYTLWGYVSEAVAVGAQSVRDAASFRALLKLGADEAPLARAVVTNDACNRCHVVLQLHGGTRRDGDACFVCHTAGAVDRGVGAKGAACATTAGCQSFETCQDTDGDTTPDTCVIATDPTPDQTVALGPLAHAIHLGRLLEGYNERHSSPPGKLTVVGFQNAVSDFSDINLPQDARNCTVCHADTGAACGTGAPCAVGQACVAKKCANVAWKQPGAKICLSCHDSADAFGHAAINTYAGSDGPIETCEVCHGVGAAYAVDKVHDISSPYVPPYPREKP